MFKDKGCGHAVIDPIDDDKYEEYKEQYKERDYNKRLECPMWKQWYHNEECNFLQRYCISTFLKPIFVAQIFLIIHPLVQVRNIYYLSLSLSLSLFASLIRVIIKKPCNFTNRKRLTQHIPGSKNFFVGAI